MKIEVSKVVFRDDLYPRIKTDPTTVQKYAEDIKVLPPIELNQHNELIDGWHRWTAHKKTNAKEIEFFVTPTKSDTHLLELAIERNATHGIQLSLEDKKEMARRIYLVTPEREREEKKKSLQKLLSVSERSIQRYLSDIDKTTKENRDKRIFDMWLACHTQEEIAETVGCDQSIVSDLIKTFMENGHLSEIHKTFAFFQTDLDTKKEEFTRPVYNVWTFAKKTNEVSHFGNSEQRILDNLLYLYTKPFDIVVDPFAGGGSTIDVCRKRLRRYYVSDRKPIPEREKEIRKWDITEGLLPIPRWQDVRLVYLDPPYWKQSEGKYSNDAADLANMELNDFHKTLISLINGFAKKLKNDSVIALLIQPTQWNAPNKDFTDHCLEIVKAVNSRLQLENRISCPYS